VIVSCDLGFKISLKANNLRERLVGFKVRFSPHFALSLQTYTFDCKTLCRMVAVPLVSNRSKNIHFQLTEWSK